MPESGGYVVGIGAANVDMCGRSREPIIMEDSNPGRFTMSVGGVTRNICENAARLGARVQLITVIGDDVYGDIIARQCAGCGISLDNALVLPGENSSTYISIHDSNGEMSVAVSDMRILQKLTPEDLEKRERVIAGAAAIVMDGGLPKAVLDFVRERWGGSVPVFIDPVSTTYAQKLTDGLSGCHTVKPNRLEAEVLSGMKITDPDALELAAKRILELGAGRVVITLGSTGAYYMERGAAGRLYPTQPTEVANATGAGDCFTGALIYGFLTQMEKDRLMTFAMTAASVALSHQRTIHPELAEEMRRKNLL